MSAQTTTRSGGISFLGLLAIVFITLKLVGVSAVATWSWWWVVSPLWIPLAIALAVFAVIMIFAGLVAIFAK